MTLKNETIHDVLGDGEYEQGTITMTKWQADANLNEGI